MTSEAIQQRISRLRQEHAHGEETLWRARQRVVYLEGALERIQGGILELQEVLRLDQEEAKRGVSLNGHGLAEAVATLHGICQETAKEA